MEPSDNRHWYDGIFFDWFVAPNQDPVFSSVKSLIPPGSTVLDVGCGTGRLAFQLADHCRFVCGIDSSRRNIRRANALHRRRGSPPHILFEHGTLETHLRLSDRQYDIGVISFVLHEMGAHLRVPLLRSLAGSVGLVILADFRVPRVKGLKKGMNELVEFCAGPDHYRGFRSFVTSGGLLHLIREADLQSLGEQPCSNPCAQVLHVAGLRPRR